MENKDKYIIKSCGQAFEVSKEIYDVYYIGNRKERYFSVDLKAERIKFNSDGKTITIIPSREDSYERLLEAEKQFASNCDSVENVAIKAVMLEKLKQLIKILSVDEQELIQMLYYDEKTEREVCAALCIPKTTLHDRKNRLLTKLKSLMEK